MKATFQPAKTAPSPISKKTLQHSVNPLQLLANKRYCAPQSAHLVVQRNEVSQAALSNIAHPKVGQQNIELVQGIHSAIEAIYSRTIEREYEGDIKDYNGAVCLGGIILPEVKFRDFDSLLKRCRLVNLGNGSMTRGIYDLLGEPLKKDLVRNTLETMEAAGQLDYLKVSNFAGDADTGWQVVIEIQYYRERNVEESGMHKDTKGQTLFANLNYLNAAKIAGPEYIVKPAEHPEHLASIARSLPAEFMADRRFAMDHLPDPTAIDTVDIPEYGYVALVDELIHHASPKVTHRKVLGKEIHAALKGKQKENYNKYWEYYESWKDRSFWHYFLGYQTYLGILDSNDECLPWLRMFNKIENGVTLYDRTQINNAVMGILTEADIDLLVDNSRRNLLKSDFSALRKSGAPQKSNYSLFGSVRLNELERGVTADNRHLKRQMSANLDTRRDMAKETQSGGRRSFFRTWVRAERADTDFRKPEWTWKNTMITPRSSAAPKAAEERGDRKEAVVE